MAADFVGMKPRMMVKVGDTVKRGQKLFEDRKAAGVFHCAPGAGRVTAVNRGDFRALQSVVIELNDAERQGSDDPTIYQSFDSYAGKKVDALSRDEVVALLVESGLWTTIRQRPYGRVPTPDAEAPRSIFVTATDSHPLSADPDEVMAGREDDFAGGLAVVSKLTEGKTFLCKAAGSRVGAGSTKGIAVEEFGGPHPSGTVGFHIHTLDPVNRKRTAWHLNYQDVIQIGRLFETGKLDVERVIALAGPQVEKPRLLTTRVGANLEELTAGQLVSGDNRVISGSVLFGDAAAGERLGFLGRYHLQVCVLREGREREFLGWLKPGGEDYSVSGAYASQLLPDKKFAFSTALNGSHRHMVPLGMYERVFPFDMLPTFLLRAIAMDDLERAEKLGALELDEEDLSLCTFVDPGKNDYGQALRRNLDTIWKEG
jgi:Na+-transporting NADH:ubiquinone oxidoreductase subunit A